MAGFQDLSNGANSLKHSSEEMAQRLSASMQGLGECLNYIAAFAAGTSSGNEGAAALNEACKSLGEAATSMLSFARSCEEVVKKVSSL